MSRNNYWGLTSADEYRTRRYHCSNSTTVKQQWKQRYWALLYSSSYYSTSYCTWLYSSSYCTWPLSSSYRTCNFRNPARYKLDIKCYVYRSSRLDSTAGRVFQRQKKDNARLGHVVSNHSSSGRNRGWLMATHSGRRHCTRRD